MELPCALGWVSGRWSTGPTASCSIPSMALLIRLDAVYGPGRVPEATGTGTSCPVRLGSPTGDSRREVEPPGRRLRAASAAPARRDFIRHIELAARGRAATYRAFPSVLAPSAVRSRSILGGTSEGGGLVKVFVTLLTGIQGQREGVYEVNRDFLKRLRRPGVHQPSDQCRPARCQHESRGQGRHWSGVRRSTAAPATPARRLLRSESRRSSSPRHSSWSLSFSVEIFSAAWRAPMSSNMERVAAMPDASLYVNRDGRRADDCVDSMVEEI